jgi:phosphate acyltransferase|tara:strand:- start:1844 stop:2857 length:1014 start_codon:yes stop_codon:yes gene_type:complete
MGGDFGPQATVPASLDILIENPSLSIAFFGDSAQIKNQINTYRNIRNIDAERFTIHHCPSSISMSEKPSFSVRNQQKSSMWQALKLVSDGRASACVSAGNTGALMAISILQLGCLPGISRPAICTKIPTLNSSSLSISGYTYLLDVGANVMCSGEQLHQFSLMASQKALVVNGIQRATVGLLNIGTEDIKGRQETHDAAELLEADSDLNYVGFIEGDSLLKGAVDIAVCDGFTGNIALKTIEGVALLMQYHLNQELSRSFLGKFGAFLAGSSLKKFYKKIDPVLYNGASLLGLNEIVVKSHGSSGIDGFSCALTVAVLEAKQDLPRKIKEKLSKFIP